MSPYASCSSADSSTKSSSKSHSKKTPATTDISGLGHCYKRVCSVC